jgi:hypothetical protein
MLPEVRVPGGDRRDVRSDITAVCAILYFCLTGHKPGLLRDSNDRPIHRSEGCAVREVIGTDVRCQQVELLLDRGLAHDIAGRFQTWDEFLVRLRTAQSEGLMAKPREMPQEAAARLGTLLLKHDLTARIEANRPAALAVLQRIAKRVQSYAGQISKQFVLESGGILTQRQRGASENWVAGPHVAKVRLATHSYACNVRFIIDASGEQLVLRHSMEFLQGQDTGGRPGMIGRQPPKTLSEKSWTDVTWFAPSDSPDDLVLNAAVDGDIVEALNWLTDQVLPRDVPRH